ncbi:hydrolase [Halobacteriovorax marinus]|uniref:Hydrolase n=1 Tax=Halobacteriovorax marinus TaxID=97084 RepID=A0A1Y5F5I6_9BACT|nr:hydrolase [Halobacteriovorax marinus]
MNKKFFETLTEDNCVLAMIDHQTGLMVGVRDFDQASIQANIQGLCELATTMHIPSIITASMPEGPNGPVMPEIFEALPEANYVPRAGEVNAWDSEEFVKAIKATGKKKIIMAGIVTDVCLMFPAIAAVEAGFDVYAVIDASGTWNKTVQEASIHRMNQAGVKISSWASVLAEIMKDWRSEKAMELGQILAKHTSYKWVVQSFMAQQKG